MDTTTTTSSPSFDANEPTQPSLSAAPPTVNLASQVLAISICLITCEIHEYCDGTCSSENPIQFRPPIIGECKFRATVNDPPRSNLPPIQENPIPLPTEEFCYPPIDSEAGEVRVLRVREADFRADPVVVEVVTININSPDCPKYGALSYYWGEPKFDHTIICDGKLLKVNPSLNDSLKRHRQDRREKPEFLWADAICINQKDKDELNLQLLLMGKIYHGAETVFVDLGDIPLYWYMAWDLMHRIKFVQDAYKDQALSTKENFLEVFAIPPFDHDAWKAFLQLFSSPWFKRTWTIQETVLAAKIHARFGRFSFDWTEVVRTIELVQMQGFPVPKLSAFDGWSGMTNFHRISRIRSDFRSGRLTPMQLLWRTRDCEVSNPRDKVVALLGMITHRRETFQPDYTWPVEKLFFHFDAHVLKYFPLSERGAMLSYAGLHLRKVEGNLPSWAPDWLAQSGIGPAVFATLREKPFNAAKGTLPVMYALGDYEKGECFVTQTSFSLGKITSLSNNEEASDQNTNESQPATTHEEWLRNMTRIARIRWLDWYQGASKVLASAFSNGGLRYDDPEEAFAVTLLAGDQYTGECATHNSVPILQPRKTLAEVVAEISSGNFLEDLEAVSAVMTYSTQTIVASGARRFAITDKGYMGLVPTCSRTGDGVYLLGGVSTPFVMRHKEKRMFVLVGDAYVHGVMEGEAAQETKIPDDWEAVFIV